MEHWAACMERRRGGKKKATLPDLGCFRPKYAKQEQPGSNDFRIDNRLPGGPFEPSERTDTGPNEPSSSDRSRPFSGSMWSVPIGSFREYLGEPLWTFRRPAKRLRGEQDTCVVYWGRNDPGIRDRWPFSLPLSVLTPYYESMGSGASTNTHRNGPEEIEIRIIEGVTRMADHAFHPILIVICEIALMTLVLCAITLKDPDHYATEMSYLALAEGALLTMCRRMANIQAIFKTQTIPFSNTEARKER